MLDIERIERLAEEFEQHGTIEGQPADAELTASDAETLTRLFNPPQLDRPGTVR